MDYEGTSLVAKMISVCLVVSLIACVSGSFFGCLMLKSAFLHHDLVVYMKQSPGFGARKDM